MRYWEIKTAIEKQMDLLTGRQMEKDSETMILTERPKD